MTRRPDDAASSRATSRRTADGRRSVTVTGGESPRVRDHVRVEGTVQGVGFRPFVFRLAQDEGLSGYVLNDRHGVVLEVEGTAGAVQRFLKRLRTETPPLARIEAIHASPTPPLGESGFRILTSGRGGEANAPVAPDWATCPECLAELTDPTDRRFRYPFINCTNCGPRFTIVEGVPYDRPLTTMASFTMCPSCRREYEDPLDRRFHAQPNACPVCGPHVRALRRDGEPAGITRARDAVQWIAGRLAAGAVVAVKGLGGFHLVCDAADSDAVTALRERKHREDKPFAVMVDGLASAGALAQLGAPERELLCSGHRPIVLAPRRAGADVAPAVAPGAPELGVMLPYTPLHHLLLSDFAAASGRRPTALVMTSGNVSDEPIAYRDEDALERLGTIADLFLVHDRRIATRTDDSVVRVVGVAGSRRRLTLRRSRGYVPAHLRLPVATRPLLACGAEQKSTFCVAKGDRAWVSHHIGDLEHYATHRAFTDGVEHFQSLFAVTPELIVHDLHPDYLSTRYAFERQGVELLGVQHHHAHLAACLAEHGMGAVHAVGAIFDGTGYGLDGTIWGGELLVGGLAQFERAGRLRPVRMPGGAAAIRQPWRMACAWLTDAFGEPRPRPPGLTAVVDERRWHAVAAVGASPALSPLTSSMGRLFDAVGALCGAPADVSYEGQAAVELEARAWRAGLKAGAARGFREDPLAGVAGYAIGLTAGAGGLALDPRPAIRAIAADLESGASTGVVAVRFHAGIAASTVAGLVAIAGERGLDTVVLSGGVFQNRMLLESVEAGCRAAGLRPLIPTQLPPNDGGISFGQAAVAAARGAR